MRFGIAVYVNEDFPLNRNLEYVNTAKEFGIDRVFTSMHLPEVDYDQKLSEIIELISDIKKSAMKLTIDISPVTLSVVRASVDNLQFFAGLHIDCLRLDYGFRSAEIVAMANNQFGIGLELNASTIGREQIEEMIHSGVPLKRLRMGHNFYPHPFTGLSSDFFIRKTTMLKEYGIPVAAFIPSQSGKRGPLYEGLPTLEQHRYLKPSIAARHLTYLRLVDEVYFGDAYAVPEELREVASLDDSILEIGIKLAEGTTEDEKDIIFAGIHTNRTDASEYIIRSEESRGYARIGKAIAARNCLTRGKYMVTIDNIGFKRYSGELQICMSDLPPDHRVNVVGHISADEHILADLIKPGVKFRFKEA